MFKVSENAVKRVQKQRLSSDSASLYLRVGVDGGGCAGFKYSFSYEDAPLKEGDNTFPDTEAFVVIDSLSLSFLSDSTLDYVETLGKAGFEINNPAATARCGCGTSFAI